MYNTENYREQGGEKWVVNGELEVNGTLKVGEGSTVSGVLPEMDKITDATSDTLLTQFNALLTALKAKGYMANA